MSVSDLSNNSFLPLPTSVLRGDENQDSSCAARILSQTNSVVMTEPETETESGPPTVAGAQRHQYQQQLAAGPTEGGVGGREEQREQEDEEVDEKVDEEQQQRGGFSADAVFGGRETLEDADPATNFLIQLNSTQSENVSHEGVRPRPIDGLKEDEVRGQDAKKEDFLLLVYGDGDEEKKPEDENIAERVAYEMKDRVEEVVEEEEEQEEEEDEEEDVEEEEEEQEEVAEDKEGNEDEEEEEEEEEEEDDEDDQARQQQVILREEKMEEEEEEDEEDDMGEEDELNERDGSPEEQAAFLRDLRQFFKERRMEYKAPKFYGEELNVLKLWRAVTSLGGYDQVTAGKLWRKVGEQFQPPKTCTTLSWSFRGFYEKALLEYERFQTGLRYPVNSLADGTISGTDSQAMSPTTPSSQPSSTPASGSGRQRRDAATRAMHGWHARLGNGETGDPMMKERSGPSKKEKQLKNLVGSKRKDGVSLVERAVKVARSKNPKGSRSLSLDEVPSGKGVLAVPGKALAITKKGPKPERSRHVAKAGGMDPMRCLKLVITDDGQPADWVKINAYMTSEGYEIYALVPGLAREEVRIQCEEGGRVVICGTPEQPNNPWGVTPFRKVVNLPSKIDAHHTSAVVTLYGQLFVRVPFAHPFQ